MCVCTLENVSVCVCVPGVFICNALSCQRGTKSETAITHTDTYIHMCVCTCARARALYKCVYVQCYLDNIRCQNVLFVVSSVVYTEKNLKMLHHKLINSVATFSDQVYLVC